MRYLILFVILINAKFSVSQDCSIVSEDGTIVLDLTDYRKTQNIGTISKNKKAGDVLTIFDVNNVTPTRIDSSVCNADYFAISIAEGKLTFKVTDQFANLDTDLLGNTNNSPYSCQFYLYFDHDPSCTDVQARIFLQYQITDYNLHDPEFSEDSYELKINYPIANGVSLSTLANQQIVARDIDFSTKAVTFKFSEDSQYFDIKPGTPSPHNFPVDIIAKQVLNLQRPVTLTLIATDDGTEPGPNSKETTITISPGENSTPPTPEFEKPYYEGGLDVESAQENDIISTGIKLSEEYDNVVVHCGTSDYFSCERDQNNIDINVILLKKPEEDLWSNGPVVVLPITAEITGSVKPGIAPFVITLKNIPLDSTTTTSTETTAISTGSTESSTDGTPTGTDPTGDGTPTDTDPTGDDTPSTPPGTDPTGDGTPSTPPDTDPTGDGTPPNTDPTGDGTPNTDPNTNPTDNDTPPDSTTTDSPPGLPCTGGDDDQDPDLLVAIIVLSIIVGVLLVALAILYFKYIKGRNNDQKAHLLDSDSDNIETIGPAEMRLEERRKESVESETFSKPLDALPENDEIEIQNEIDRKPKGLDSLIAELEENNLLKPDEVKSRKRSMTFSESDDESRQYREDLSKPVMTEVINENKPDPVRKKSVVTFKL